MISEWYMPFIMIMHAVILVFRPLTCSKTLPTSSIGLHNTIRLISRYITNGNFLKDVNFRENNVLVEQFVFLVVLEAFLTARFYGHDRLTINLKDWAKSSIPYSDHYTCTYGWTGACISVEIEKKMDLVGGHLYGGAYIGTIIVMQ